MQTSLYGASQRPPRAASRGCGLPHLNISTTQAGGSHPGSKPRSLRGKQASDPLCLRPPCSPPGGFCPSAPPLSGFLHNRSSRGGKIIFPVFVAETPVIKVNKSKTGLLTCRSYVYKGDTLGRVSISPGTTLIGKAGEGVGLFGERK